MTTPPSHHQHTEGREAEKPFVAPENFPRLILNWFLTSPEELIFLSVTDDETAAPDKGIGFSLDEFRAFLNSHAYLSNRVKALEAAFDAAIAIANEAAEEWDKAPNGMRAGKILLALAGHRKGYRADIDAIHSARTALTHGEKP